MAIGNKCYSCGKGIMVGHNVSHAKNRTRKVFKPNLHKTRIKVEGRSLRVKLCTKCKRQYTRKVEAVKNKTENLKVKSKGFSSSEISTSAPAASSLV